MTQAKTIRRLVDFDSMKQYKTLKQIAKDKGFTGANGKNGIVKKYVQFLFRREVENYNKKQLDLFEKSKEKIK
jgi:hypothetical protein